MSTATNTREADRTPTRRYFQTCERLDDARIQGKRKRIALLIYGLDVLHEETREALAEERRAIRAQVDTMFKDFAHAFQPAR